MRLTDYALLFFILFLCGGLLFDCKWKELEFITRKEACYNRNLDNAAEDAMGYAVEEMDGKFLKINPGEIRRHFFQALWINFGVWGDIPAEKRLKEYIPVMVLVCEEGSYFYYRDFEVWNGEKVLAEKVSACIPYKETYGSYEVYFSLSDDIKVYDVNHVLCFEGKYQDGQAFLPEFVEMAFEQEKRRVITELLKENMGKYINSYQHLAKKLGIQYQFFLPSIEKEDWYRTVEQVSLLVVFQGYPYGNAISGFYNRMAVGGARIFKPGYP